MGRLTPSERVLYPRTMTFLAVGFWLCAFGLFYIYIGYPVLIHVLARLFSRPVRKGSHGYSVTVIMSVYNEAPRLAEKLRNVLSLEGSERICEILVGSDGSTDDPVAAAAEINDPRIKLIAYDERRGKPSVLNKLIEQATGDILVLMDVRQRIEKSALMALLANFADRTIGVVSAEMMFERSGDDSSAASGIDAYWRYEKWIRTGESRLYAMPGATGALYAIRRELAWPIPPTAALDDVLIPMHAIAQGYRCIMEPEAVMYDRPAQDTASETIRKRRTLAGCVQLMAFHPRWCLPGGHPIWWQFTSHKIARLFSPFLMTGALVFSSILAVASPVYAVLAAAQWCVYGIGAHNLRKKQADSAAHSTLLPRLAGVFLAMQHALLLAWKDSIGNPNLALWKKAENV